MIKFGKQSGLKAVVPDARVNVDPAIAITGNPTPDPETPRTGMLGRLGDKEAEEPLPYSLEVQADIVAQETTREDISSTGTRYAAGIPGADAEWFPRLPSGQKPI